LWPILAIAALVGLALAAKAMAFALNVTMGLLGLLVVLGTTLVITSGAGSGYPSYVEQLRARQAALLIELARGYELNGDEFPTCSKRTLDLRGPAGCSPGSLVARGKLHYIDRKRDKVFAVRLKGFNGPGGRGVALFASSRKDFLDGPVTLRASLAEPADPKFGPLIRIPIWRIQPAPEFRENARLRDLRWKLGATREEGGKTVSYLIPPKDCSGGLTFRSTLVMKGRRVIDLAKAPCPAPAG